MKTTRKIVNDCFFKGRKLDYKQHKAIIDELNARDDQNKRMLNMFISYSAHRDLHQCSDYSNVRCEHCGEIDTKIRLMIASIQEANHAQTDNQINISLFSGDVLE